MTIKAHSRAKLQAELKHEPISELKDNLLRS